MELKSLKKHFTAAGEKTCTTSHFCVLLADTLNKCLIERQPVVTLKQANGVASQALCLDLF